MTDMVIAARRQFLKNCGKFAVATPATVTLLLSAAERNYAVAASGSSDGGFVSPFQSGLQQGSTVPPGFPPSNSP
jgi:hypothetical protein